MKEKFVVQWHITVRCNLRCKHCYIEDYDKDIKLNELIDIFEQIKEFLFVNEYVGHINFTGGEPFIAEYLWDLLDLCERNNISFGILTNGTLINQELVHKLQRYKKLKFIQFSLDGGAKIHDDIRGKGSFHKTAEAIRLVNAGDIQTMVSFTASKLNYMELRKVIRVCRRLGVKRFWTDRLVPMGSNELTIMSNKEFTKYLRVLNKEYKISEFFGKIGIVTTSIHINRAMQFMCSGSSQGYKCSAGKSLLAILEDGTLLPCRRLPVKVGNLFEDNLCDLYAKSDIINMLKGDCRPKECKECFNVDKCLGGAKCITYAIYGDIDHKDFNCPYVS